MKSKKHMIGFTISLLIAALTLVNVYVQKKMEEDKDKEIEDKRLENVDLQLKLAKLTNDQITGGNNVPYTQIIYARGGITVLVTNKGETPIYDLQLELYNWLEPLKIPNQPSTQQRAFRSERITLGLGENATLYSVNFENEKSLRHDLSLRWRNGSFQINLNLKSLDDKRDEIKTGMLFYDDRIPVQFYKENLIIDYNKIQTWDMGEITTFTMPH